MENYEMKLREYWDSLQGNPIYKKEIKNWAFGAVDFAYNAGLISKNDHDQLNREFGLLE